MPGFLSRAEFVFPTPEAGTGPFEFGFAFATTDDEPTTTPDEVADFMVSNWTDTMRDLIWEGAGAPQLVLTFGIPDGEIVHTTACPAPTGAHQPGPGGASLRVVISAPRPPKARNNAFYLPLPEATTFDVNGLTSGGAKSSITAWAEDNLSGFSATDFTWVALHQVGGPTADIHQVPVVGASLAPTVSFLRRRYR
jgi:hypothetical protein